MSLKEINDCADEFLPHFVGIIHCSIFVTFVDFIIDASRMGTLPMRDFWIHTGLSRRRVEKCLNLLCHSREMT